MIRDILENHQKRYGDDFSLIREVVEELEQSVWAGSERDPQAG